MDATYYKLYIIAVFYLQRFWTSLRLFSSSPKEFSSWTFYKYFPLQRKRIDHVWNTKLKIFMDLFLFLATAELYILPDHSTATSHTVWLSSLMDFQVYLDGMCFGSQED